MQLRTLFATLALGAALSSTPAHAQTLTPCELYLCMAGISGYGTSGGPACVPALAFWHAPTPAGLAIWTYPNGFQSQPSATLRRNYLSSCTGSNVATNAAVLNAIISEWGYSP